MAKGSPQSKVVKLMNGTAKKNPQRINHKEPVSKAKLRIPRHFNPDQKRIWREVIKNVADGVFQASDTYTIECIVNLLYRMRSEKLVFTAADQAALTRLLTRCGMTPVDRQKLSVEGVKPKNDFDDL